MWTAIGSNSSGSQIGKIRGSTAATSTTKIPEEGKMTHNFPLWATICSTPLSLWDGLCIFRLRKNDKKTNKKRWFTFGELEKNGAFWRKERKKGKRTQGHDWACRRSWCSWPNQALWACRPWRVPPWNSPSPPVTGTIRNSQRDRRFSDDHKLNQRCNQRTWFRHRVLFLSLSLKKRRLMREFGGFRCWGKGLESS